MTLISLRQALDAARAGTYGVGAFNVTDLMQVEAVLEAARQNESPVIVQTLAGSSAHGSDELFWDLTRRLIERYSEVPVVMHLDHGPNLQTCVRAMDAGFTSVMIDGSINEEELRPATFEENVAVTAAVVDIAHTRGISVEGELGTIGGSEDGTESKEIVLANPDEAAEFVSRTHVDALAVAIGTSHGAYKFASPPDSTVLHMDLITEIATRVPDTHLVMHGSSSLPADLRAVINANGGSLPESWGVPEVEKARSTAMGIRKINQGMDSHMAYSAAVRQQLGADGVNVDPASYLSLGRIAMQAIVADRMRVFGQAGHASDHLVTTGRATG